MAPEAQNRPIFLFEKMFFRNKSGVMSVEVAQKLFPMSLLWPALDAVDKTEVRLAVMLIAQRGPCDLRWK